MAAEKNTQQVDVDLKKLEFRVNELISACEQLTAENRELRNTTERLQEENKSLQNRQEALYKERANLLEKTESARTRVEGMITRLKALETAHE